MHRYFLCFWQESWFCHAKTRKKFNFIPPTSDFILHTPPILQISILLWPNIVGTIIAELDDDNICKSSLISTPHICQFWYTATLLSFVYSTPKIELIQDKIAKIGQNGQNSRVLYAKTSQELRMLSRSLSDCQSTI